MVERKPVPLLTPSQESLAHPNASPVEPSSAALAKLADALQTIASKNEKRFEATRKTGLLALDRLKAHVASLEQSQKLHARISADSARNEEILSDRLAKAKAVIQEMDLTADPDVDEFLIAQNRVYNQLYELTSEEAAIDDTIYALGRALEDEQIELGLFLKVSLFCVEI
jgi:ESCRT-I complex subunit TSG101